MLRLLDTLFLQPFMVIYDQIFGVFSWLPVGARLIIFSIVLNLLLLPIYRQMERRFRSNAAVKEQGARDVARMKKHFKGRERYFYIRAVYRQYGYHPLSDLLGSADLFVQVLVFATMYRYLSGLEALVGESYGPIADLSKPDGLLAGINVLPLLMTAINAIAVFFYVASPRKRRQGWVLAAVFFVLLYRSPSGLVLYWTVNNVYALVRTLVQRRLHSVAPPSLEQQHRSERLQRVTRALGRLRFPIYALSVGTAAALVLVVVPTTIFLTSPGELSIHLNQLLYVNASIAMAIVYVAAALYAALTLSWLRTALTVCSLGALALMLIYSYVMPFGYPAMTGLTFEQLPTATLTLVGRVALDAAIVIAVAFVVRTLLLRFGARSMLVGVVLVSVSLGVAATSSILRDRVGEAGDVGAQAQMPDRPLRFSRTQPNTLIIFLDRFMGSYVESILAADPQMGERLSGFTWYPRTLAAGENSIAGLHPLLGGYDYMPLEMNARGKPLRDLSVEAFSILPYNFAHHGYRANVVAPRGLGFTMAGDCSYLRMKNVFCTHISARIAQRRAEEMHFPLREVSSADYADLLVLLAAMRSAPYAIKELLHEYGPWREFMNHSAGTTFREWAELGALPELSQTDAAEPNFNFVSNILPHEPYYLDESCRPQLQRLQLTDEEARQVGHQSLFSLQHSIAARCALYSVADYLDFLKAQGVYDNTRIVIVSDHGIKGAVKDNSSRAIAGGTQDNIYVRTRSLLLVKDRGTKGALRVSEEFMPNAEVPRIVCTDIGGCVNPYLNNKPIAANGRDDPFYVTLVPWQFNLQEPTSFVIERQLTLRNKDPYQVDNWTLR
jgi:membrane protein insertase Oxa1/YidC/SpoIIIJ